MSEEEEKAIKKLERGALEYIDSNEIEAVLNLIKKQNNKLEQLEKDNISLRLQLIPHLERHN